MTRPIKFRAWDGKRMCYSDKEYDIGYILTDPDNQFSAPMQFTGLLDKNGKEIYEGDIVTARNGQAKSMKVVWGHHAWGLSYSKTSAPGFYDWNINELEIIGNIYENPDLISVK